MLCICFECQKGEPVPIRYTRAFKLHKTYLLVPNTTTLTNFLHAPCNTHGILMSIVQVDRYVVHVEDVIRMGTHCPISVLAAGLHVTGSMAGVVGSLMSACLKKSIRRKGNTLQLKYHLLCNFCFVESHIPLITNRKEQNKIY